VAETKAGPKLDGKLDDEVWKKAPALHLARTLDGSRKAAQPTEVRLLRDAKTLYVACRCVEPLLGRLKASPRGHDGAIWSDDSIEIFVGLPGTYYHFGVNALGSTYDARRKDASWNCGFKAAVSRESKAWTLELAIPLAAMVGKGKPPVEWTANFNRNRYAAGDWQEPAWSPTYSGDSHVPARFGKMFFKEPPTPRPDHTPARHLVKTEAVTILPTEGGEGVARFDLSELPRRAKVYRADVFMFRTATVTMDMDEALVDIEIYPLFSEPQAGAKPSVSGKPLALRGPWYDRFDVTAAVQRWASGKTNGGFFVKACPLWNAEATCLDVWYQGETDTPPPQPKGVRACHRAGQTFITWTEIEKRIADERATWGTLKRALDGMDARRVVRYRIRRHSEPITARNIHQAECLAEVKPLSGYNIHGRSPDQAFHLMRKRMLVDMDYARRVSKNWYGIPASAHDEVIVDRFVVPPDDKPLPVGAGLYVHHPAKAGKAYYAVASVVDGRENTSELVSGQNVVGPVEETVGLGAPVFQRTMDLKVLFDYPGERRLYVQWVAPPLSNRPNQYCNWSVFIPRGVKHPAPMELFLSSTGMFRRPRWPHRLDTILVSPHDAPLQTWYYGHHQSVGTLRSLRQGTLQPYTWRRMLAFLNWASAEFRIDKSFVVCSGDRGYAATAALHFGMRHPEVFSLIYTCKGMPNPAALPTVRGRRDTLAAELQKLIGRREWGLRTDSGENAWQFFNLTREVAAKPQVLRPMLSYGGRGHWDWPPIGEFINALAEARQPIISRGEWGAVDPPGLKNPGAGRPGLNVRRDRPIPVFTRCSSDYQGGRNGDGGSTNLGIWWDDESIVDEGGRFEVVLTGNGTVDVTPRRMREFVIKPRERIRYRIIPKSGRREDKPKAGEVIGDSNGLITIPGVLVRGRTHVILTRSAP